MSGFILNNVRDPRSQDPDFKNLEIIIKVLELLHREQKLFDFLFPIWRMIIIRKIWEGE